MRVYINKDQYLKVLRQKYGTSTLAAIKSVRNGLKTARDVN